MTTFKPPFSLYMDLIGSWEEAPAAQRIASNPATDNYLYRDANGILTDRYGNIGKPGDEQKMLARTKEQASQGHHDNYFVRAGINQLPAEIQPQLLDISVNGGPGRATDILGKVLAKAGEKYKNMAPAEAAAAYLKDVGMTQFNNEIAAERIAFYDELARRNPAKAVNLNGWHRRAAGFIMDKPPEEYARLGFKVVDGKVSLPDQVDGPDGKPAVKMPDGTMVAYYRWYWDNVLSQSTNGKAKFDDRRRGAIQYRGRPTNPGDWGDDDNNSHIPLEDWTPQDRMFFQLAMGILNILFAALSPRHQQSQTAMPTLAVDGTQHQFGSAAPNTPVVAQANIPNRGGSTPT